jgi:hypothetical protein
VAETLSRPLLAEHGDSWTSIAVSAYQESVTDMLRRCQNEMLEVVRLVERITAADMCKECERLLTQFIFAMLNVTGVLEERQARCDPG